MYTKKRLQNIVTTSSLLLPAATVICALLWFFYNSKGELSQWIGLACCAICTALVVELNNTHVLIRIRTRMVSTLFLLIWSCNGFLHPFQHGHVLILCMLICYHALFSVQQGVKSTGVTFLIFLSLGFTSLLIQPMCILILPFFLALNYFRSLSFRSFLAGILGFILPAWLVFSCCFLTDNMPLVSAYASDTSQWVPFQYTTVDWHQIAAMALLLVLLVPSILHFLQNNYQDKIRVRMLYYFMLWMQIYLFVGLCILPHLFNELFLLIVLNSCPLIAHFFTLTNHKFSNIFFMVACVLVLLLIGYNLWMPL